MARSDRAHLDAAVGLSLHILHLSLDRGFSERAAFAKAAAMKGAPRGALRTGFRLSVETIRRLNLIDASLRRTGIDPDSLPTHQRNCLRVLTYWAHFGRGRTDSTDDFLRACRRVLGPEEALSLEEPFGDVLTMDVHEDIRDISTDRALALRYCVPEWYVDYLHRWFGWRDGRLILEGHAQKPVTYVRLNTLRGAEAEIRAKVEAEGLRLEATPLRWAYKVTGGKPPASTRAYNDGLFEVQDLSSVMAVQALGVQPNCRVLEIGAAPGGKTAHLAQLMENSGEIYSIDISPKRMLVWLKAMSRLGVTIARPVIADGTKPLPLTGSMDYALVDAPCSNTGVLHKTPSLKWRLTCQDIRKYSHTQIEMLNMAAPLLKPGGHLAYSTCSIAPEEDELVIEEFLRLNPEFYQDDVPVKIGVEGERSLKMARRLFTHLQQCNGAFVVRLRKN